MTDISHRLMPIKQWVDSHDAGAPIIPFSVAFEAKVSIFLSTHVYNMYWFVYLFVYKSIYWWWEFIARRWEYFFAKLFICLSARPCLHTVWKIWLSCLRKDFNAFTADEQYVHNLQAISLCSRLYITMNTIFIYQKYFYIFVYVYYITISIYL